MEAFRLLDSGAPGENPKLIIKYNHPLEDTDKLYKTPSSSDRADDFPDARQPRLQPAQRIFEPTLIDSEPKLQRQIPGQPPINKTSKNRQMISTNLVEVSKPQTEHLTAPIAYSSTSSAGISKSPPQVNPSRPPRYQEENKQNNTLY